MRWMRGVANAMLMATLVKPLVHRMVERWRRRARESAVTTIGIPVQELLEAALIEELAAPGAESDASPAVTSEQLAGRGTMRTMLIAALLVVAAAGAAAALVSLVRRRRTARRARAGDPRRVAVPVEVSAEEVEKNEALETVVE